MTTLGQDGRLLDKIPITISIPKTGEKMVLMMDANGNITHNGKKLSLKLTFDHKNIDPDSDAYFLLEANPEQNKKQCKKKTRVGKQKVRCQYIQGHGASHIYNIGGEEYVDKSGKRVAKRGFLSTPKSFKRGWKK
jgi:hypothetical protein